MVFLVNAKSIVSLMSICLVEVLFTIDILDGSLFCPFSFRTISFIIFSSVLFFINQSSVLDTKATIITNIINQEKDQIFQLNYFQHGPALGKWTPFNKLSFSAITGLPKPCNKELKLAAKDDKFTPLEYNLHCRGDKLEVNKITNLQSYAY